MLQLAYPDRVDGLMLVNCTAAQAGWVEWGYQKVSLQELATICNISVDCCCEFYCNCNVSDGN